MNIKIISFILVIFFSILILEYLSIIFFGISEKSGFHLRLILFNSMLVAHCRFSYHCLVEQKFFQASLYLFLCLGQFFFIFFVAAF